MASLPAVESPVLVLSDLHLGHPASFLTEPRALLPLLGGSKTVVFNGDTCELVNRRRRARGIDLLGRLAETCLERGARPVFLTGNHDPEISSAHYLDLLAGSVFVTHGDVLHPTLAPWAHYVGLLRTERRRLVREHGEPETLDDSCRLAKRMAQAPALLHETRRLGAGARLDLIGRFALQPWRIGRAVHYWANAVRYGRSLRDRFRPAAHCMLVGHSHRAGVWQRRGFTLVDTGSFLPFSRPLAVLVDERATVVRRVVRSAGVYRLGKEVWRSPSFETSADESECARG